MVDEQNLEDLIRQAKSMIYSSSDSDTENTSNPDVTNLLSQLTSALEETKAKSDTLSAHNNGEFKVTRKRNRLTSYEVEGAVQKSLEPRLKFSYSHRVWFIDGVPKHIASELTSGVGGRYGWKWHRELKAYATGIAIFAQRLDRFSSDSATEAFNHSKTLESISESDESTHSFDAPDGLEYLPYQIAGIAASTIQRREGILIGDEMGLGKTVQAAGVINNDKDISKVLVLAPAFLCINWQKELQKWTFPIRSLPIWRAKGRDWDSSSKIVIMSYDSTGKWLSHIHKINWDLIVCDECHYLKNPKASRTRRVLGGKIDKVDIKPIQAKRRLMLTGTPILNHPLEILPIAKFCDPVSWPDSSDSFCDRYGYSADSANNLRELHKRLRQSIMIRRLKKDVLTDLPPKRRQVIEVDPDDAAQAALAKELKAFDDWKKIRVKFKSLKAQKGMLKDSDYRDKLRKLREGTTAAWSMLATMRRHVGLQKVPWILAAIEEVLDTGEKLIVFCHHQKVARQIKSHFGDSAVLVNGKSSPEEKNASCEQFQDPHSEVSLFIGGLKSAGVGLTLTAASTVLFAELDWTPAVLSQAEDRAHRFGQLNPVLVQHVVLAESLDARMSQTLIRKQEVAEQGLNVVVDGIFDYMGDFGDM